jgi:spoIIIJ-associated protein
MEAINKVIKELFQAMGFNNIKIDIKKDNSLKERELLLINIKTNPEQADYLIKEGAIGLNALQRLVRVLVSKRIPDQAFFILDINNYRKEREKFLIDLALKTAEEVRKTKKPITLESMPAYERRFIHLRLAEQSDIVTESIGQEPERKVVVRLYP